MSSTYNVQTAAFSSYWTTAVPKRLTINSGVTLGHLTIPASMAGTLIIDHSGAVQGLGGTGNGGAGSTAMTIQSTGVTINMASGSTISGGGGAGGNGGTGGQGSASANSCSCGGTVAVVVRKMTTVAPTLSYVVIIIITILVGLVEPLGLVRATINLELTVVADRLAELTQVLVARAATLVLLESLVTMVRQE